MKKKIIIGLITLLLVIGLIIVVKNLQTDEKGDSLERILNKKTFILGLDDSFPPMGYRDENNNIVGFDIDVAKEVCDRLGVELVLQPITWTANEQELNSYNIDCIWNGMSVTDSRKNAMSLSKSYLRNKMIFVVKNDELTSLEDLKGKKIGVQSGSSAEGILQNAEIYSQCKEVVSYTDNITAFMDLEINQIDAVLIDNIVADYYITSNNKDYKIIDEPLAEEEFAIGFRKDDTVLRDKIDTILLEMKEDGSLSKISEKWFGKDITIIE